MGPWPESSSASPAASPRTRRASSCGCSSRTGTTSSRSSRPARSASSRARPSRRSRGKPLDDDPYPHLTRADLLVVAPCTANTLAKLAHGLADTVLTEAALAHRGPLLVAPAMNPRMWAHPATQANAETLRARGVELVGPDEGDTGEGEWGVGRMAEPEEILERVRDAPRPRRRAAGPPRPRHGGRDARADRRRPLRRQPLVRPDGRRARRRGPPARGGRDAARRQPGRPGPGGRRARRDADRGRPRARGARAGATPTS